MFGGQGIADDGLSYCVDDQYHMEQYCIPMYSIHSHFIVLHSMFILLLAIPEPIFHSFCLVFHGVPISQSSLCRPSAGGYAKTVKGEWSHFWNTWIRLSQTRLEFSDKFLGRCQIIYILYYYYIYIYNYMHIYNYYVYIYIYIHTIFFILHTHTHKYIYIYCIYLLPVALDTQLCPFSDTMPIGQKHATTETHPVTPHRLQWFPNK